MNLIEQAFRRPGRKLIPFITAGDPDWETSLSLIRLLDQEDVTAIELGVPYTDPLADGPVIQAASDRALAKGMTLTGVLELARTAREEGVDTPLILFSYYNPLLRFGLSRLTRLAKESGIDGMIVPDLPFEESADLAELAEEANLCLIPLTAPTSKDRIERITAKARGFVYCVSSLGTTGTRSTFSSGVEAFLDTVKKSSPVPTAIGFGISRREHVDRFLKHADAVVVGSALVRMIEERLSRFKDPETREEALEEIRCFVRDLAAEEVPAIDR
ncbi:tryptophan synthase subunit alpha [Salinithrix halophila]|uniref:Tryptophan synthase alpha chain n=1 Tax=Salinithrix halophila TaxID=1485204 RepID=A0ABV8JHK4_9BACL